MLTAVLLVGQRIVLPAAEAVPDAWLPEGRHPGFVQTNSIDTDAFATLQAEALAGRLKVHWTPPRLVPATPVTLYVSADAPGRWSVRDWRPLDMPERAGRREVTVPVDRVDVPLIYFVAVGAFSPDRPLAEQPPPEQVSPLRVARPEALGMSRPSRVFWPFLEGFEENLAGWRLVSESSQGFAMSRGGPPRNGRHALALGIPAGKGSVTAATTRLRGWQAAQQNATGFSIWLRSERPGARARFTLFAHTSETNLVAAPSLMEVEVDDTWRRFDMVFADFRGLVPGQADLLAIECIGDGPAQFWLDDLQLLGRWPIE